MDFGLSGIFHASEALRGWFQSLRQRKRELNDREQMALERLGKAVTETRLYLKRLDRAAISKAKKGQAERRRARGTEEELSRLWTDASIALRRVNQNLAERCYLKGGYWADPENWSAADIKSTNIAFEEMDDELHKFLTK